MPHPTRVLDASDAPAFHALRLEALAQHPEAFRATFDEEADQTVAEVARRLEEQTVFGVHLDGELVGVAGFEAAIPLKKRHKGLLWGVYVRPDARCAGLGTALVGGVIAHARGRVEQLHAAVVVDNAPARHLYRKLGFGAYGIEPRALKVGDRYYDQELLVFVLDR